MALALWGSDSDSDDELQGQLVFMREQTFVQRTLFSEVRCVSRELAILSISRNPSPRPRLPQSHFYYKKGTLVCRKKDCMIIASFGDKLPSGVNVAKKAKCKDTSFLPGVNGDIEKVQALVRRDETVQLRYVYPDFPGVQRSRGVYMDYIKDFLSECQASGAILWFTGHGVHKKGDWVFKDGVITFQDIFQIYLKYFRHRLLYIVCDCCYAGQWIDECAKALDREGVKACGHKAKEAGIMIKIFTAASWNEKALDGVYSATGVCIYENTLGFYTGKCLTPPSESEKQTAAQGDFTHTTCYHHPSCHFSSIPQKLQWTWEDLTYKRTRDRIKLYTVRGKDRGKQVWHFVLVYPHKEDEFHRKVKSGTIDVANYGHVIRSGWGQDPPSDVTELHDYCNPFSAISSTNC